MTDENFYQRLNKPLTTVLPSLLQYCGLIMGVTNIVIHVSQKNTPKEDPFGAMLGIGLGLWGYLLGKKMESAHRSDAIANSFTHLEETLREEFKRNNQSRQ